MLCHFLNLLFLSKEKSWCDGFLLKKTLPIDRLCLPLNKEHVAASAEGGTRSDYIVVAHPEYALGVIGGGPRAVDRDGSKMPQGLDIIVIIPVVILYYIFYGIYVYFFW